MKPAPVARFEIYVQDLDRAKAFYESVFQTTLQYMPSPPPSEGQTEEAGMEMWAFPMSEDGYGASGTLIRMTGVPSGAGPTMVYFHCDDCGVEAARATESGGSVFRDKKPIGEHAFLAIVNDTEGNMIGLHSTR